MAVIMAALDDDSERGMNNDAVDFFAASRFFGGWLDVWS